MKPTAFKAAAYIGILLVAIAVCLLTINPKPEDNLPDGFFTPIIALEFIQTPQEVQHFFDVKDVAKYEQDLLTGNLIDYVFMCVYSALLCCIALGIKKITQSGSMYLAMVFCGLMLVFDGLENYQIYKLIVYHGTADFTREAGTYLSLLNIYTWLKWSSIAAAFLLFSPFFLKGRLFHKIIGVLSVSSFVLCIAAYLRHGLLNELFANNVVLVFLLLIVFAWTFQPNKDLQKR